MGQQEENIEEPDYLTIQEVSRKLRFHPDTLKRHMRKNKLKGIEWVDFLGNGQLRATRKSVEWFIQDRRSAMEKIYSQSLGNSRA